MIAVKGKYGKIVMIICCIVFTALTLTQYAALINHLLNIEYNWLFEIMIVVGMIIFQYPVIYKKAGLLKLDYYFNMLLVSLMGSMLLWPLLLINTLWKQMDVTNVIYFFAIVVVMFVVHKRVVTKMLLPVILSYTYIGYRFIILLCIIKYD